MDFKLINVINDACNLGLESSAKLAEVYAQDKNLAKNEETKNLLLKLAQTIRNMKKEN